MKKFIEFLYHLKNNNIPYELTQKREDYILVDIKIPDEKWEVEFSTNGEVVVKRFGKIGEVKGEKILDYLLNNYLI